MEAFIRIGDWTLTIVPASRAVGDDTHVATMQDTWKNEATPMKVKQVELPNEVCGCLLAMDALLTDGPTPDGPFMALFPEFGP